MMAVLRNNLPDVAYPTFSRRVFEEAIKQFQRDSSLQNIILTDAKDRDRIFRHLFSGALREVSGSGGSQGARRSSQRLFRLTEGSSRSLPPPPSIACGMRRRVPRRKANDLYTAISMLWDSFMKEVPPVNQANKPNEIAWYLRPRRPWRRGTSSLRRTNLMWRARTMTRRQLRRLSGRGARPLRRLSHAARLRVPGEGARRRRHGVPPARRTPSLSAPNLRSDLRTGLGGWSKDDIVTLMKTGHNDRATCSAHARRHQQQHAISEQPGPARDGGLSQVALRDGAADRLRV